MTEGSEMRGSMEALMLHYEVDVVFNGHVHAYERTNPVAVSLSFPWSAVAPARCAVSARTSPRERGPAPRPEPLFRQR